MTISKKSPRVSSLIPVYANTPNFEDLLCLGCAHLESIYIVDGHLKLCKKFALALWNATTEEELKLPTKRFDNCGFLVPDETDPNFNQPFVQDGYFLPSEIPGGLLEFIQLIQIPYYDQIKDIDIIDGDSSQCFSRERYIHVRLYIVALIFIALI